MRRPTGCSAGARGALALALLSLPAPVFANPQLTLQDTRAADGGVSIATDDWKIVYSTFFNGGIQQWFDLTSDPEQRDNLSTDQGGGYNQGTLFDYDVYLGADPSQVNEFMTTLGRNRSPGALDFRILESTPTRIRILQKGNPRLNNGSGPRSDPFLELKLVDVQTIWTIYPTGKIAVDFRAERNPAGESVDSGPGGAGKAVQTQGDGLLDAAGGTDFLAVFATSGDFIESPTGGWGPIRIKKRLSPTQLMLESPAPAGRFDYAITRKSIFQETISIHADGDPLVKNQCSDPGVSRWAGGSSTDPTWLRPASNDPCRTLLPDLGTNRPDDVLLVHAAKDRPIGSLLSFFEPWRGSTGGFFSDVGFTDISFTQLGRTGQRPFENLHMHFLTQMGSATSAVLPSIRTIDDATPFSVDFRTPFAEAVTGTLASGPEIAGRGFDPGSASYRISAASNQAAIRFDASGGDRKGFAYRAPVVQIDQLAVEDANLVVEISRDGGIRFAPLESDQFNLSTRADEAQIGRDRRVFQLLGDIPATATGAQAWVLRFRAR